MRELHPPLLLPSILVLYRHEKKIKILINFEKLAQLIREILKKKKACVERNCFYGFSLPKKICKKTFKKTLKLKHIVLTLINLITV